MAGSRPLPSSKVPNAPVALLLHPHLPQHWFVEGSLVFMSEAELAARRAHMARSRHRLRASWSGQRPVEQAVNVAAWLVVGIPLAWGVWIRPCRRPSCCSSNAVLLKKPVPAPRLHGLFILAVRPSPVAVAPAARL